MKRWTGLLAAGGIIGTTALAAVAGSLEQEPRAMAQLGFSFGDALPQNFHYGLRLDYVRSNGVPVRAPAVLALGFDTRQGLQSMWVGGVDVVAVPYMLRQAGVAAGAAAGMSAGSIAMAVAGVAAAAVVVSEASDDDSSPLPSATTGATAGGSTTGSTTGGSTTGGSTTGGSTTGGSTTGGSTTGGSTTGGSTTGGSTTGGSTTGSTTGGSTTGGTTGGILGGITGTSSYSVRMHGESERQAAEYNDWLDGGTGHMGDIH